MAVVHHRVNTLHPTRLDVGSVDCCRFFVGFHCRLIVPGANYRYVQACERYVRPRVRATLTCWRQLRHAPGWVKLPRHECSSERRPCGWDRGELPIPESIPLPLCPLLDCHRGATVPKGANSCRIPQITWPHPDHQDIT